MKSLLITAALFMTPCAVMAREQNASASPTTPITFQVYPSTTYPIEDTSFESVTIEDFEPESGISLNVESFRFYPGEDTETYIDAPVTAEDGWFGYSVTVDTSKITSYGEWTMVIPAGAFTAEGGAANESQSYTWDFTGPAPEPERFGMISADPTAGSSTTEISQFTVTWEKDIERNPDYTSKWVGNITKLYDSTGAVVSPGVPVKCTLEFPEGIASDKCVFKPEKALTQPFTYQIRIYADVLKSATGLNEEVFFTYIIPDPNATEPEELTLVATDPADGSTLEELSEITTTWSTNLLVDWWSDKKYGDVVNADNDVVAEINSRAPHDTEMVLVVTPPVTASGEYRMVIEPNVIESTQGKKFAGTTLTYVVEVSNSVNDIHYDDPVSVNDGIISISGDVTAKVFSLTGTKVAAACGATDIPLLPGCYIVVSTTSDGRELARKVCIR